MVHVAAKKLYFFGEVVVEPEIDEIILEGLSHAGAKTYGVGAIAHVGIVSYRHHVPQLLDGRTDTEAARITLQAASWAACRGIRQIVLDAIEDEDAVAQRGGWDDTLDLRGLWKAAQLIISEEKCLILADRPANAHTYAVIVLRLFLREFVPIPVWSVPVVPGVGVER